MWRRCLFWISLDGSTERLTIDWLTAEPPRNSLIRLRAQLLTEWGLLRRKIISGHKLAGGATSKFTLMREMDGIPSAGVPLVVLHWKASVADKRDKGESSGSDILSRKGLLKPMVRRFLDSSA